VIFNNGAWFSPKYLPSLYLGCIKNCVKVLADHEVDEIVVFDVGPSNTKELLYDLPKFTNVPISICGGINNIYDARAAISAGFDRVGVNITNKS
jgi:imidazole glycerol phosphate synthase subunit HisF